MRRKVGSPKGVSHGAPEPHRGNEQSPSEDLCVLCASAVSFEGTSYPQGEAIAGAVTDALEMFVLHPASTRGPMSVG
ncbi:MAG: hypothetical protein D6723_00005, partial [Acidobacteria bacterium]